MGLPHKHIPADGACECDVVLEEGEGEGEGEEDKKVTRNIRYKGTCRKGEREMVSVRVNNNLLVQMQGRAWFACGPPEILAGPLAC